MSESFLPVPRSRRLVVKAGQLAGAVALLSSVIRPPSAGALVAATAVPDSVVAVESPGIALHIPADGRINGDGFAAEVTGYRFASRVGFGASTIAAPHGQRLLVFALQGAPLASGTDSNGNPTPTVRALLAVDGAQEALPPPASNDRGPDYFMASIPSDAADVELQLSRQGFTQTFSFTAGGRRGAQPTVLYRTASDWEATDPVGQTVTMATPDPAENLPSAAIDVTLSSASLTWFGPAGTADYPADPGQAWLVLDLSSQAHSTAALATGETLDYLSTLPASAVTLTIPGQAQPIPAELTGQGGPADESTDQSGFLGGVYYWPVPADLTTASVKITPGTISAEDSWLGSPQSIPVPGSATFSLSFGSPYQPPPPPASPPADANPPRLSAAAGRPQHSSGGPVGVLIGAGVALVVLCLGLLLGRRHRRRTPVTAVASSPTPVVPSQPIALPPVTEEPAPPTPPDPIEPLSSEPLFFGNGSAHTSPRAEAAPVRPSTNDDADTPPRLFAPPPGPVPPPDGYLRLDIIGKPRLWAWDVLLPEIGPTVLELLALLALHPAQRFSTEQLQFRLGLGRGKEPRAGTVRRYINELRRLLGEERVPASRAGEGYWVQGMTTDFAQFCDAVGRASTASTGEQRARHLADALSLVRGVPFEDVENGAYGWADRDPDLTSTISRSIRAAAAELVALALAAGDGALAEWAAEKGRLIDPTDDDVLLPLLEAAALQGLPQLHDAWPRIRAGFPYGSAPSDRLVARYQQLLDLGAHRPYGERTP